MIFPNYLTPFVEYNLQEGWHGKNTTYKKPGHSNDVAIFFYFIGHGAGLFETVFSVCDVCVRYMSDTDMTSLAAWQCFLAYNQGSLSVTL